MELNLEQGSSIEWQKLFPIVAACSIWHPFFAQSWPANHARPEKIFEQAFSMVIEFQDKQKLISAKIH